MQRVSLSFNRYTDGDLESKVHTIISNLTGNTLFPSPVPSVAVLSAAAAAYSEALVTAKTGNRSAIAEKNSRRLQLIDVLRNIGSYVNFVSAGDISAILTSGFSLTKEQSAVVIGKPENFRVVNGVNSGDLELMVNRVKGATAYLHEFTTDASLQTQGWISLASSSRKLIISNLQAGVRYYCRVGVVGTRGQLVYSDQLSRIVI
ncbi:MAG: hypothetical protein QM725_04630 [Lacibacter sp.]